MRHPLGVALSQCIEPPCAFGVRRYFFSCDPCGVGLFVAITLRTKPVIALLTEPILVHSA